MARKNINKLVFPKWNPQKATRAKFENSNKSVRYVAVRNSSSAFIKRKDVREYIFKRDGHKCVICGNDKDLQIDHINSVYKFINEGLDLEELNIASNLQILCKSCNSRKLP